MSSYTEKDASIASDNGLYKAGDFIIFFGDCKRNGRNCDAEMRPYLAELRHKEESLP